MELGILSRPPPACRVMLILSAHHPQGYPVLLFTWIHLQPFGSEEMPSSPQVSKKCWLLLGSLLLWGGTFLSGKNYELVFLLSSCLFCSIGRLSQMPWHTDSALVWFLGGYRFSFLLIILILFQRGSERQTIPLRTSALSLMNSSQAPSLKSMEL